MHLWSNGEPKVVPLYATIIMLQSETTSARRVRNASKVPTLNGTTPTSTRKGADPICNRAPQIFVVVSTRLAEVSGYDGGVVGVCPHEHIGAFLLDTTKENLR